MTIDINSLLLLPEEERRQIAEQLWDSLAPSNAISKEDVATLALLEERWQNVQSGKSKVYSSAELKDIIKEYQSQF